MNWKTYTYFMYGRARLIRVSDGKVLGEGLVTILQLSSPRFFFS
jgi:hypothetical protein